MCPHSSLGKVSISTFALCLCCGGWDINYPINQENQACLSLKSNCQQN